MRERKVVQWTLAYCAAAFALLQALQLVGTAFGWGAWTVQAGVVVAALGAVATAVISWYHGDRGAQRIGGTELLVLAGLFITGAAWLWQLRAGAAADPLGAGLPTPAREAVIAVLPFDNLGPASDQGFVDGLHDETISRLASVGGFGVISRTSTLGYRDVRPNLRKLARELGASHVLEGTVQRDGERIRLRVQFIDAATDAHLFARSIERDGARLFEAQALLAVEVAEALRARMGPNAMARLERQPTPSAEAYSTYLEARQEWLDSDLGLSETGAALDALLDRALALDPGFVEALTLRAVHDAELAFGGDAVPARSARARAALAQLRHVAPEHPLTWLAEGKVRYHLDLDYEAASVPLRRALAELPGEPIALNALAWLEARRGRVSEARTLFARMARLDPRSVRMLQLQSMHHEMTGDYEAFLRASSLAVALDPASVHLQAVHARARRAAFGDAEPMRALVGQLRDRDDPRLSGAYLAWMRADADDCAGVIEALEAAPETLLISIGGSVPPNDAARARCHHRLGKPQEAAVAARRALALLDSVTPPRRMTGHLEVWRGHMLGLAGRRDEALARVKRGRELAAASGDAIVAGEVDLWVLTALIDLADFDGATAVARQYLERDFPRLSAGELLAMPMWSPLVEHRPELRRELRQRLDRQVESYAQATVDAFGPAVAAHDRASRALPGTPF